MTLSQIKQEIESLKTLLTNFVSGKTSNSTSAAAPADASALQTKLTALETSVNSQLTEKDETITDQENTIKDLRSQLKTAQDEAATLKAENGTLKTSVENEKKRANETLASMGIDIANLPVAEATQGGEPKNKESDWAKYHRLQQTNPREAGQFWAQNADKIMASKPKS